MKFITESELRDIYKIHPFTTYEAEPGTRLTPGARQYLSDMGVRTFDMTNSTVKGHYYGIDEELKSVAEQITCDLENVEATVPRKAPVITIQGEDPVPIGYVRTDDSEEAEKQDVAEESTVGDSTAETDTEALASEESSTECVFEPCDDRMLLLRFKSVKADFLLTGQELLKLNIKLDQELMTLCEQFSGIHKSVKNGTALPQDLDPTKNGITDETGFSDSLEDPFEVTSFHMQLPNGREILLLHKLRCSLQLLTEEVNEKAADDRGQYMVVTAKLNQIINIISQMINDEVGGK